MLKDRSRLGVIFYCRDKRPQEYNINGYILNIAAVIKNVVDSATYSEFGACFQNAQIGVPLRVILMESGHKQTATPLRTEK